MRTSLIPESEVSEFMQIMSNRDGIQYSSFTMLNFSRPAVCLTGDHGEQKTVSVENLKQIMREERHND